MKKIAQSVYSLNLTDSEAFKLVKLSASSVQNKVVFAVKTYSGSMLFDTTNGSFNKMSKIVGGDDKLLSLYDDMCNKYLCSSAKVILIQNDSDADILQSKINHNQATNTSFMLMKDIKDNRYYLHPVDWIQMAA
jgi:hypothetical protein